MAESTHMNTFEETIEAFLNDTVKEMISKAQQKLKEDAQQKQKTETVSKRAREPLPNPDFGLKRSKHYDIGELEGGALENDESMLEMINLLLD